MAAWGIEVIGGRGSGQANFDLVMSVLVDARKLEVLDSAQFYFVHVLTEVQMSGFGTKMAVSRADEAMKAKHMEGIQKFLRAYVEGLERENVAKVASHVEEDENRAAALCRAAVTLRLGHLYMTSKKKVGKKLRQEVEYCSTHLPFNCKLNVFHGRNRVHGLPPSLPSPILDSSSEDLASPSSNNAPAANVSSQPASQRVTHDRVSPSDPNMSFASSRSSSGSIDPTSIDRQGSNLSLSGSDVSLNAFNFHSRQVSNVSSLSESGSGVQEPIEGASPRGSEQEQKQQLEAYMEDELEVATHGFSPEYVIGRGAFGTVYKGTLRHVPVAIKRITRTDLAEALKEFNKELKLQVGLRHPDLVMLIGHCQRPPCLVYELMEEGSLFDRLTCLGDSPPLPWHCRFQIFVRVCRAIAYLHGRTPPMIHLDLKPANILLDGSMRAKVGDVGLSQFFLNSDPTKSHAIVSTAGGTYGYTDPNFLRRGQLSPSADVYSLGQVLWDLLIGLKEEGTAKDEYWDRREAAQEATVDGDSVKALSLLEKAAGPWPPNVAMKLCQLAARCVMERKDKRPKLEEPGGVMQTLQELSEEVKRAIVEQREREEEESAEPPDHFICPIDQRDVMVNPVMAADGHTYEKAEIEKWLNKQATSPMTGLPLSSKVLMPNHTLRSLIQDWQEKSKKKAAAYAQRGSRSSRGSGSDGDSRRSN